MITYKSWVHHFKHTADFPENLCVNWCFPCIIRLQEFTGGRYSIFKVKWGAKATLAYLYLLHDTYYVSWDRNIMKLVLKVAPQIKVTVKYHN